MFLIALSGVRVDLQSVVVNGGIFEEAVVGIKHLLGEQIEPLTGDTPVVQARLVVELDPQAA